MPSIKHSHISLEPANKMDEEDGMITPTPDSTGSRKRARRSYSPPYNIGESALDKSPQSISVALNDDEDELELRATQLIQEKYSFASDEPNVPAEHGIIERVECYNFMCHNHFCVDLGPLINFIVGKNGSGKSAVLTAITLCLGGKASATNRGQSLKSFIKEGKENSTIVVRIKNHGEGAFMPDDYGKSIIVERHFSKNGTSSFKLKAENGRIVSTKKAELDSIIDFFTLQFDNPMNVLSQDMARQFLSSSTAAEKYKFFIRGVQLEQLDQDYRLIEESGDQILEKLNHREQDIKILKSRKDLAQHKLGISDQHDNLRKRVRAVRNQMAWAQVEEQEKMRDELDDKLANADNDISSSEAGMEQHDVAIQSVDIELEAARGYVTQAAEQLAQAQSEKEEIKSKWDEQMSERHDLQAEQRQIKEYLKAAEARLDETRQKIDQENQRLLEINGGSLTRRQKQLEEARQELFKTRAQYEEHKNDATRLYREIEDAETGLNSIKEPISKTKADIEQAESNLQSLVKEGAAKNSGFMQNMPVLLKAIEREQSFNRKPVGPIGHYVTLLKPEWSYILENSIGNTLNSFIVGSKTDMNILSNIMQNVNCDCPIFIGNDGYIDTSNHEPDPQFETALRVLQIDHDLVRRHLIINHGIEQMLLVENLEEASSILYDGPRPNNVKRCYCIDQTDRRRGIHLSYSRTGEPSQSPVPAYTGAPRMKSDHTSRVRLQREVVAGLKRELSSQEKQLRSAQSHLEACKQARIRHERATNELRVAEQRKEDFVEEMADALDKDTAAEDGQIDLLRATLQEVEEEKRLNEGSLQDSIGAMDAMMHKLKMTKQELNAKEIDIVALSEGHRVAQSEEAKIADKRRKAISDKNAAIEHIEAMNQSKARLSQEREYIMAQIFDFSEKASLISPRVDIPREETASSLDKKLDRLHKDIERYNNQLGATREEIGAEAAKAKAAYDQALKQIEEFRDMSEVLKATLQHRQNRWLIFRSHISTRAKAQFTYLLSERSFRGRLLTDHDAKILDLQVEPDITKDSAGRGARTLSGGEKSFSQVCLLLALWEAMGSPIRCLDEFDVYMDPVNRKMAIDMLMQAARRSIGRQFIFITPGSRAEITLAPDVRVKELAEPERGQTRLSFL